MDDSRFIPHIEKYDKIYKDQDIEKEFQLEKEKSADLLGHYASCPWFVIELKSKGKIGYAQDQIVNTLKTIQKRGINPQFLFIIADSLSKRDKRTYTIAPSKEHHPFKVIKSNQSNSVVKYEKIPLFFIYKREINKINKDLAAKAPLKKWL